ncbi:MAG: alpha-amylase family glycosyl hydrolase [bacterium]
MSKIFRSKCLGLLILLFLLVEAASHVKAQVSWWEPEDPQPGDSLAIYYDDIPGTLPDDGSNVKLHWGINETGHGLWQEPPESMWPPGTVRWGDNRAVQSPMTKISPGLWQISIATDNSTNTLHYVVTNGVQWDNNDNANWDIFLFEEPAAIMVAVQFLLDTRSAHFTFDPALITTVNLAGTFNGWSRYADTMTGPDKNGVYSITKMLQEGYYEYKFVVNHQEWFSDPDNPHTNPMEYNNSILIVAPDTLPSFADITPEDGAILIDSTETVVAATIIDGDLHDGIDEATISLTLDDLPVDFDYDPETSRLTSFASDLSDGVHQLAFDVSDRAGRAAPQKITVVGVYPSGSGYHYLDSFKDDIGTGAYIYPDGVPNGAADLLSLQIGLTEEGDSLRFHIGVADITEQTVLSLILTNSIAGTLVDDLFGSELRSVDWNGAGVYVPMISPNSPHFEEGIQNVMYVSRDPMITGPQVELNTDAIAADTFIFSLSLSDLSDVLGTFTDRWYCCIYSYLTGAGDVENGVTEISEAMGGTAEQGEPDVYDMMFCDSPELQARLLANYTSSYQAVLDNEGRGYASITPAEIDSGLVGSGITVAFLTRGGTTLKRDVDIVGTVSNSIAEVTVFQNGSPAIVPVVNNEFIYSAFLDVGENAFRALVVSDGDSIYSSTLLFYRKFYQEPQIVFSPAIFSGGTITLDASRSTDPDGPRVFFQWSPDPENPSPVVLDDETSATPSFSKPEIPGEYYFDLAASDVDGYETYGRTFVTVTSDSAWGSGMDHNPQWVRDAVLYEIYVRSFSVSRDLAGATSRLPEIKDLGVTAIWLMPINEGPSDHGYAVSDYYTIEADYGTMDDFREFIATAHDLGLRVIIDHVVNHSSIDHPFFGDMYRFREHSFYYNFYERREELGAGPNGPYLSPDGLYTYYFNWTSLANLNMSDVDAEDYFLNMATFYVDSLDVDGFRCDVAWGIQDRYPDYWPTWRRALKTTKPDILSLAEASATDFVYFDQRFDSAYDWTLYWQGFKGVLASGDVGWLHEKIINEFAGTVYGFPENAYPLRFLENHDEQRFVAGHTVPQTKVMAALLLTIPGLPLIYAGQEVGETSQRGLIDWSDPYALRPYYQKLISIRQTYPSLRTKKIIRLNNGNNSFVYSFYRRHRDETVIVNLNFSDQGRYADVALPVQEWGIDTLKEYYLTDVLNEVLYPVMGADLDTVHTQLEPYQAQILVLGDSLSTDLAIKGDVNGDGEINVVDVVRAVNIILSIPPPPTKYECWAADFNDDGAINILDVVGIVNEYFGGPARF